jgi:glycine C-acetyltransferase
LAHRFKVLDMLSESAALRDQLQANTNSSATRRRSAVSTSFRVVPNMFGEASLAQRFAEALIARAVYVIGLFFPVVPQGKARIRTQIFAAHPREDLVFAIE